VEDGVSVTQPQLASALDAFLASPKGATLHREQAHLRISRIFEWFSEDFEGAAGSIREYVTPHLPEDIRRFVQENEVTLGSLPYDWSLNESESP